MQMPTSKNQPPPGFCQARVTSQGSYSRHWCQRKAVKDGWCAQHHPKAQKARDHARHVKWEMEHAARQARRAWDERVEAASAEVLAAAVEEVTGGSTATARKRFEVAVHLYIAAKVPLT